MTNGIKLDLTINIPVMITVVVTAVSGGMWVANVDAKANSAAKGVEELSIRQAAQDAAIKEAITSMRNEVRMDMRDMGMKVDQIIWRLGDPPKNLQQWERK